MDKQQEPQRGRNRLDEIRELAELSNTIDPSLHTDVMYALAYHVPALYTLAVACRDAAYAVEQAHREYEAQWMVKYAESIKAIIEALAPLLAPIEAEEGETGKGE